MQELDVQDFNRARDGNTSAIDLNKCDSGVDVLIDRLSTSLTFHDQLFFGLDVVGATNITTDHSFAELGTIVPKHTTYFSADIHQRCYFFLRRI